MTELLHGAFDRIGDLLGDLFGAGPWIRGNDQGFFNGKFRVLEPAHPLIGHQPADNDEQHHKENNAVLTDGDFTEVHG